MTGIVGFPAVTQWRVLPLFSTACLAAGQWRVVSLFSYLLFFSRLASSLLIPSLPFPLYSSLLFTSLLFTSLLTPSLLCSYTGKCDCVCARRCLAWLEWVSWSWWAQSGSCRGVQRPSSDSIVPPLSNIRWISFDIRLTFS